MKSTIIAIAALAGTAGLANGQAFFEVFVNGAATNTVDLANDWTGLLSLLANFNSIGFGIFDVEGAMSPYVEISRNAERILAELSYGHDWLASVAVIGGLAAVSLLVLLRQIGRPGEGGAR